MAAETSTQQRLGSLDGEKEVEKDTEKGQPGLSSDTDDATIAIDDPGLTSDAGENGATGAIGVKEEAVDSGDPNVVFWDGPDDPHNPMNWPEKKKWLNIAVLSILTLVT